MGVDDFSEIPVVTGAEGRADLASRPQTAPALCRNELQCQGGILTTSSRATAVRSDQISMGIKPTTMEQAPSRKQGWSAHCSHRSRLSVRGNARS